MVSWGRALLRDVFWLSMFWALLSPAWCFRDPPKWRFTISELVIPRKVPHRMGGSETPNQLAYSMRFRGQRHVIHMKLKKNLLPRNFPVFSQNDQGATEEDYPFIPQDCYYYSYLEGVPGSAGTLDTCRGGLHGMLQVDDFTYEIKPLEVSSKFEHVVSLLILEGTQESRRCKNDDLTEETKQFIEEAKLAESPRAAPPYLWRLHMKHMKNIYLMSHSFGSLHQNQSMRIEIVVVINSIVDTIYKPSSLNVYVCAIFDWAQNDLVNVSGSNVRTALREVGQYKRFAYSAIDHSVLVLLTGHMYSGLICYANHNGMCSLQWGVLFVYMGTDHAFLTAAIVAHAAGHSIGANHDTAGCVCFRRHNCVMHTNFGLLDTLSNCTHHWVLRKLLGWDLCLSTPNIPYHSFGYEVARCGNKLIDRGEECDCGSLKECAYNRCCKTDCFLTTGSMCNSGGCCQYCQFASSGTTCRDKNGICDLPEYCDGNSEVCPNDFYIQDGTPCSPLAVCIAGNCSDRNTQCRALFGYHITDGPDICYEQLNTRGDRFGNCGVRLLRGGSRPLACKDDNVFCGLVHCSGIKSVPGGGEHTTFHHIKIQDVKEVHCFGYDAHHGAEVPEMGLVVDGATCGPGKFCRNQNCTFYQDINFNCDVSTCNFRGVCNNINHCHCKYGWKPPACDQKGLGGSQDSGPPPNTYLGLQAYIPRARTRILLALFVLMILVMITPLCCGIVRELFLD